MKVLDYLKHRKAIIGMMQYSLAEVDSYKYLTKTEKNHITSEIEFKKIKKLINQ